MSDDELEQRLQRMPPAPLPNDLMARLIAARPHPAALPPPLPETGGWLEFWFGGFGGVAVLAVFGVLSMIVAGYIQKRAATPAVPLAAVPAPQPTRIFLPVAENNYLVRADDLGVFARESPNPFRLVRCVWVDDATFHGTDGTSNLRVTRPREQIVPLSLATY